MAEQVAIGMARGHAFIDSFVDMHNMVIEYGKWGWHFEWSEIFGPTAVSSRTGDPLEKQPSERSPFWRAASVWARQGKRTEPHGGRLHAVWNEPPAGTYTVTPKGVVVDAVEPEGFDEDYSDRNYVDEAGRPVKLRKRRVI